MRGFDSCYPCISKILLNYKNHLPYISIKFNNNCHRRLGNPGMHRSNRPYNQPTLRSQTGSLPIFRRIAPSFVHQKIYNTYFRLGENLTPLYLVYELFNRQHLLTLGLNLTKPLLDSVVGSYINPLYQLSKPCNGVIIGSPNRTHNDYRVAPKINFSTNWVTSPTTSSSHLTELNSSILSRNIAGINLIRFNNSRDTVIPLGSFMKSDWPSVYKPLYGRIWIAEYYNYCSSSRWVGGISMRRPHRYHDNVRFNKTRQIPAPNFYEWKSFWFGMKVITPDMFNLFEICQSFVTEKNRSNLFNRPHGYVPSMSKFIGLGTFSTYKFYNLVITKSHTGVTLPRSQIKPTTTKYLSFDKWSPFRSKHLRNYLIKKNLLSNTLISLYLKSVRSRFRGSFKRNKHRGRSKGLNRFRLKLHRTTKLTSLRSFRSYLYRNKPRVILLKSKPTPYYRPDRLRRFESLTLAVARVKLRKHYRKGKLSAQFSSKKNNLNSVRPVRRVLKPRKLLLPVGNVFLNDSVSKSVHRVLKPYISSRHKSKAWARRKRRFKRQLWWGPKFFVYKRMLRRLKRRRYRLLKNRFKRLRGMMFRKSLLRPKKRRFNPFVRKIRKANFTRKRIKRLHLIPSLRNINVLRGLRSFIKIGLRSPKSPRLVHENYTSTLEFSVSKIIDPLNYFLSPVLLLFFLKNPFLFKVALLSRPKFFDSTTTSFIKLQSSETYIDTNVVQNTNIVPNRVFSHVMSKKLRSFFVDTAFKPYITPWYYNTIIRFIEFVSGKQVILKTYPFLAKEVSTEFMIRYKIWLPRMAYYERKLGHRFFLEEAIHIFHLGFFYRDATILIHWLKSMILRINFWRTRTIFRYLKYVLNTYFIHIFRELDIKGLKIKLKGKISVAGNSRKRAILLRAGLTSHATVDFRVLHECRTISTFTGVMGLQLWLFY